MPAVDEKVLKDKIDTGKPLTKEEEAAFLQQEGAVDGYHKADVEDMSLEEFDTGVEGKKAEEVKAEAEVEQKPKEEVSKPVEQEKPKETDKPGETKRDFFVRLEQEFVKEEGKEDLTDFSPREKAYYRQMRLDRKNRQKAEAERDAALFRETKLKKQVDEAGKAKPTEEDPIEALKKKDPTDYMTVAEVTALIDKVSAKKEAAVEDKVPDTKPTVDPRQMKYLKMCEKEAREAHPDDFDAVMELTDEIINNSPEHLTEVAKALVGGENPALVAYELIKKDSRFSELFPVAQTKIEARKETPKKPDEKPAEMPKPKAKTPEELRREKEALKAQEALERTKTRTTGHVEAAGSTGDEPSFEEIANMSDREFAKLPKKVRQNYLAKMADL